MALLTFTKKSSAVLPCEPSLIYEILTDYDTYSEWAPLISQSKLLAKEGDLAIAEFDVARPRKEKFAVECIHTKNKMVLVRTISGNVPLAELEWDIEPSDAGRSKVSLRIQGRTNWSRFIPGFGRIVSAAGFLRALQSQASTFSGVLALEDKEGEKILEISETEQGMVCWIRGKKYTLKLEGNQ